MSIKFKSVITLEALSNASTDTDRFLVSDSGNIKYRTGTQLLSDIGGQAVLTNPITGTGTINYISKFTGTSALGNSIIFDTGAAIGIGTTTPTSRVSIVGTTTGQVLDLKSTKPGAGGYILTCADSDDSDLFSVFGNILSSNYSINMGDWQVNMGAPYFQLNASNAFFQNTNLGIGTNAPSQKLHVFGNARVTGAYYDSTNSPGTSGQVLSSTATGTDWITIPTGNISGSGTTNYITKFTGAGTIGNSIIFDNGTNVGLGTTSPSTKLDVNGVISATGGNSTDWNAKQAALVSGTNIKTVNGNSILGSGNLSTRGIHTLVPPPSGQVTSFLLDGGSLTNLAGTVNRLYVAPYIPASTITCSSLYINILSAVAASLAKIVIYSDNNGVPGTKIYESASLNCATTGIKTATTTQTFTAGVTYWIGVHSSSTQSYSAAALSSLIPLSMIGGIIPATICFTTSPFGTAPSLFGTPIYGNTNAPFVGITI
jgi:hypothetical protein